MNEPSNKYHQLTQSVSAGLSTQRLNTPEAMKRFNDQGGMTPANAIAAMDKFARVKPTNAS